MKGDKITKIIFGMFAAIGTTALIAGILVCMHVYSHTNKEFTTAVITRIETRRNSRSVYVSYDVNNTKYESPIKGYSSSFCRGQEIEVYYDIDNPTSVQAKELDALSFIFPGIAFIFFLIGWIGIFVIIGKQKKEIWLKEHGKCIKADYTEVRINYSITVSGLHPYNVICSWKNPEDGKLYIFRSKNLYINPKRIIEDNNIQTFPVYIDSKNIKRYTVDVDIITESTVDLS